MKIKLVLAVFLCIQLLNAQENIPPNIILINIDDMGWKDVGFMGSKYYETPNIDRLASQGMVFTNGYAAASNCAPSRASLMTGLWTPRHGIYTVNTSERGKQKDRKLIPIKNTRTLSSKLKVIPQILKEKGYVTCHAGKWHLSDDPKTFGFDVNIGGSHAGFPKSYYPPYKNVVVEKGENSYLTDLITEKAMLFIQNSQQPFFLYYSPYAVHLPINPVKELLPKYTSKMPHNGQGNAKYATMIENLDRNIGLLLNSLKDPNTLIVFTSDNGGLFGITDQKPLRAGKGSYYEGGIREPFVVVWKNKIEENSKSETPVSHVDIFPTILHAASISEYNGLLDGTDLFPILTKKQNNIDRSLFWHFPVYIQSKKWKNFKNENRDSLFRTRPGSVIRKGDWKLHYYFEDKSVELFNLKHDIGEKNNVAQKNLVMVSKLKKELENWWNNTQAAIPLEKNTKFLINDDF
jgi:arylsulfatase A-like enzyme